VIVGHVGGKGFLDLGEIRVMRYEKRETANLQKERNKKKMMIWLVTELGKVFVKMSRYL
jgi:hypothetical protein